MVTVLLLAAALAAAPPAPQAVHADPAADTPPVVLLDGIRGVNFQISTRREEAQKFFDQGLALVYAFNHEEAIRSFRKAAEIDPASPMPHWGIALALGPTINRALDAERHAQAFAAIEHARQLASRAPAKERAYVAALAKRYSGDPGADPAALAVEYKEAMRQLTRTYPNDMHAATLYAESLMNLRPRKFYTADGAPAEGTAELVDVLERVLERDPDHVGANHLYIHATEASLTPERALKSAKKLDTLMPGAGHLVHMPAHTYMRTGDYAAAVAANRHAVEVDRKYLETTGRRSDYAATYYTHNLDFLASAAMMTGQVDLALEAASELTGTVRSMLADRPTLEPLGWKTQQVLLRFGRWADVLAQPAPPPEALLLTALDHFARGVAHAGLGAVAEAERERDAYAAARAAVPPDLPFNANQAGQVLEVAGHTLDARLAAARGDVEASIAAWRLAVRAEDRLGYNGPPDWFYPTRESLGAALLRAKHLDDADLIFRQDLERNPGNPRSLYGRWQTVRAIEGDRPGTLVLRRRFADAWTSADVPLRLEDF